MREKKKKKEISKRKDEKPMWINKIEMGIGKTLLFIELIDNFYRVLFFGEHGIEAEKLKSLEAE